MTLREWQKTPKDINSLIVQASSEKEDDGLTKSPIGLCFNFLLDLDIIKSYHLSDHSNLVINLYNDCTDNSRRGHLLINRKNVKKILKKNNIKFNEHQTAQNYYRSLPTYKFVISPEGNGIDCHRHYEALIAGCIPVVERNEFIERKYGNCPILYTTDYREITPDYLETRYQEMLDTKYDFSNLFLDNWSIEEQNNIKSRGNYWTRKLIGRDWYS
jgi:hypothetical protein